MKRLARLLTLALLIPAAGHAEDLADIYNLAVDNDPQLRAAHAAYMAGKESENIGRAGLLPQISASAEYSETESNERSESVFVLDLGENPQEVASGTVGDGDSEETRFSVSLSQPVFNLPAWYDYKQGATVSEQARLQYAADQQELILRVATAYFNVLRAGENLTSAMAEEEALERQLEQTQQRHEVGLLPITDVHEAQAVYDDARVNTLVLRGELNVAFEQLQVLTGRSHDRLAGLADKFPVEPPEAPATDWVQKALNNNLELQVAQRARDAARQNANARKAEHLPTLTGTYSYTDSDSDKEFVGTNLSGEPIDTPSSNTMETNTIALRLEVPIFTGGLVSAERRQAYHQYVESDETANYRLRNTTQQARTAHLNVETNAARVKARKQAIRSARSALEATRAGYDVGTRNIVDVLLAQRTLFQARRDYASSRYDYIASTLELKQVAGQLSPDDIYQLNAWVDPEQAVTPVPAQ